MYTNFFTKTTQSYINDLGLKDAIILDWWLIQEKELLLKPFYTHFGLDKYIWTYSLDTFYDIFSDYEYIKQETVTVVILNFDMLLKDDFERKYLFLNTILSLIIHSDEIGFKVYVVNP